MDYSRQKKTIREAFKEKVFSVCSKFGLYEYVWLFGDGRSGTTWVSNLINYDLRYRQLFEPFHNKFTIELSYLNNYQYYSEHYGNIDFDVIAEEILKGRLENDRIKDKRDPIFYHGILVKDVLVNLFSYRVCQNNPNVRPLLLIRNPFAVALSKQKTQSWNWVPNVCELIEQDELNNDFLLPYIDVLNSIAHKDDFLQNQIAIWCVLNLVPLSSFKEEDIHIIYYEKVMLDAFAEIGKARSFIQKRKVEIKPISHDFISRPSEVAGEYSNLYAGTSPVDGWKKEISNEDYELALSLIDSFGLIDVYENTLST